MRTFFALAPTAFAALVCKARARHNAWLLHELSDAQLKDIGLSRCDIERVAYGQAETRLR